MAIKLLALDLDGTLLDPAGKLRPAVRDAVGAAVGAGLRVVVCTGRRLRTALPAIRALELEGVAVVQNGVLVRDVVSGETLQRKALSVDVYLEVRSVMLEMGPPVVYVDSASGQIDMVSEGPGNVHAFQREYLEDNGAVTSVVESLAQHPGDPVVMMSWMADSDALAERAPLLAEALGPRIRTNFIMNKNYRGHILEVVAPDSGKWPALREIAADASIDPEEIAAIGDDNNDAEMLENVGLGIAMGNAVPAALQAAIHTAPSNEEDGAAVAIERWVLDAVD